MGAWLGRYFSWNGKTSRREYRRWLPLILAIDLMMLCSLFAFDDARIDSGHFGWAGAPLFFFSAIYIYYVGWFLLTARRLRSADISRAWMIPAFLAINFPVAGYYVNFTMVAALILTAVSALAPDRSAVIA